MTLDSKLCFSQHITSLEIKVKARTNKISWLINNNSKLPLATKLILYKQLIAPIWQYTFPVWGALLSNTQFSRIKVMQSKTLRLITGAPWHVPNETIRTDLKVATVDETFDKACGKYYARLRNHNNPEAKRLAYDPYVPNRLIRPRYSQTIHNHLSDLIEAREQRILNRHREFERNYLSGACLPNSGLYSWLTNQRAAEERRRAQLRAPLGHNNTSTANAQNLNTDVIIVIPDSPVHVLTTPPREPAQDLAPDERLSTRLPVFEQMAPLRQGEDSGMPPENDQD